MIKFQRLKIVQQIIIVLIFAVVMPFVTIGFIIANVSQHSIRDELSNSASLIAQFFGDSIERYVAQSQNELDQLASGFQFIPDAAGRLHYFDEIEAKTKLFKGLDIVGYSKKDFEAENSRITLYSPIDESRKTFLKGQININIFDELLGNKNIRERNIYLFDSKTHNLIATNTSKASVIDVLSGLSVKEGEKSTIFGYKKNTPKAYYKINNPDWFVVVDTTKQLTAYTINEARARIILSLSIAGLSIIIIVSLYTYYLYINIRQLFKAIKAISKGNYDKKIHLIKNSFTPYEIVFLSKEFNYMANKIKISHKDLKKKNKKLEQLNEFRENLINATSHEFRTPLTSIIGYTSRLLRQDIKLDDDMKIKSLQVIKEQAQRLSRMVEDLLVIPDLDSDTIKYNIEEIDLSKCLLRVLEYLKNDNVGFNTNIDDNLNYVYADDSRLEQVFLNLVDNAIKYSKDSQPIEISAKNVNGIPQVKITNKCEKISKDIKGKLFEKFIRADSKLTRTTRGTGLGLYIVKSLCEDMKIDIELICEDDFTMVLKFNDYVK